MIPDPIDLADEVLASADWGLYAQWLAALATLGGAVGAGYAAFFALRQFKQNREAARAAQTTADAALNATREAKLEAAEEKRRAQAAQVCAWIDGDSSNGLTIAMLNSSTQPVYNVMVYRVEAYRGHDHWWTGEELEKCAQEAPETWTDAPETRINYYTRMGEVRHILQVVPPGKFVLRLPVPTIPRFYRAGTGPGLAKAGAVVTPALELAFTDLAGRHWVRRAMGDLESLDQRPTDHYEGRMVWYTPLEPWESPARLGDSV